MTSPTKINFYADFQGLASLKRDAKAEAPEALKQAAKQFESLFTRELLKSMRATSMGNPLFDSEQTQFYQDMFDDQMAMHLSQGKGLGLADMLVQQLQQKGVVKPEADQGDGEDAMVPSASSRVSKSSVRAEPVEALLKNPSTPLRANGVTESKVEHSAPNKKEAFISAVMPHAERAARALGVDPHALVAQAALETGWGKSLPKDANGSPTYNLFGIKATPMWNGPSVDSKTLEFESGKAVAKQERFRAYGSASDSFEDYTALIAGNSRYAAARNTGSNVQAFAHALQNAGYATDPNYARKLTALTAQVRHIAEGMQPETLKVADATPITSSEGVRG